VPGFGIPPATISPLARWLRSGGWQVLIPPLGWNVGCGTVAADAVGRCAAQGVAQTGRPVVVVGHSRGGLLGRVAALDGGESVEHLVTVCTPWTIGSPDRPGVATVERALRALRRRGVERFASIECASGPCCARFREIMGDAPSGRWTALWSSTDGIGGPASRPPAIADQIIDLRTSHLGGVLSVPGWSAIAEALSSPA
jgi:pimeloyl-ACP methyl ester carboxylesterase